MKEIGFISTLFFACTCFYTATMAKLSCETSSCNPPYEEYVFHINGMRSDAKAVAHLHNLILIDEMMGYPNMYIMRTKQFSGKHSIRRSIKVKRNSNILWFARQTFLVRNKRSKDSLVVWNDPYYIYMWYLHRASGGKEYDMNVMEAWKLGFTGKGIKITIMDDGIDYTHPDLTANYDQLASTDINDRDNDPMPNLTDRDNKHGTRCAGQIAAQGNNSICIVGIAYNAQIGGIRMLDGFITDRVEAETLRFHQNYIDIYSGSWGPEDSGKLYEGPGVLAQSALQRGVVTGRKGFGNIYVWASGNGGSLDDSCACDGYASSPFTLSVSGVGELNMRPWYLEKCSSTLVSTYSSGSPSEHMISTIDLGHECTRMHTGTSASAPMAAGIIALLLEANNRLSWRDVQYVTLLTANAKPFKDGNFTKNAVGREYSIFYGYGLMDAGKMVRLGQLWRGSPPHHRCTSQVMDVQTSLGGKFNKTVFLNFYGCQHRTSDRYRRRSRRSTSEDGLPVKYLEHVQVYADIVYQRRGLLQLSLVSPSGTMTVLLPPRIHDDHSGNIAMLRWPVTTVQLWGEEAAGKWEIRLDNIAGSDITHVDPEHFTGFWKSVWIVAYGTDEFPIRLKPLETDDPVVTEWFSPFSAYVVEDHDWHRVYTCHSECAPGGCSGPESDQCLNGCKHFATESKQCVRTCPSGTTAFDAVRIIEQSQTNSKGVDIGKSLDRLKPASSRVRSSNLLFDTSESLKTELVCQPCWSLCAACLRPHIEYDCTACANGRFLVPLITSESSDLTKPQSGEEGQRKMIMTLKLPNIVGTCRSECPVGFYPNKSTSVCNLCAENCAHCVGHKSDDCLVCSIGYRLLHGRCVDSMSVDGRCKLGQFLKHSNCVNCHASCGKYDCLRANQCNWCPAQRPNFFNNICVNSCPTGWYSGQIVSSPFPSALNKLYLHSTVIRMCEPCAAGCLRCTNFSVCELCSPELQLNSDGLCVPSANVSEQYISSECGPNCATCFGVKSCLSCAHGYNLLKQKLITRLPPHESLLSVDVADPNQLNKYGVEIPDNVQNNHYLCVHSCPIGYFDERLDDSEKVVCAMCPQNCLECTNKSNCMSCISGFYIDGATKTCKLKKLCRQSEYFDEEQKICRSCDPSCRTCSGPLPEHCNSCNRHSKTPRCLFSNRLSFKLNSNAKIEPVMIWSKDSHTRLNTGRCLICCPYNTALTNREPTNCMFCVADKLNCLTGDEIGAGEGGLQLEQLFAQTSSWDVIFTLPIRLVIFIICNVFIAVTLIIVGIHFFMVRRRNRNGLLSFIRKREARRSAVRTNRQQFLTTTDGPSADEDAMQMSLRSNYNREECVALKPLTNNNSIKCNSDLMILNDKQIHHCASNGDLNSPCTATNNMHDQQEIEKHNERVDTTQNGDK